nr:MAG TPA: hypothetical protein [Caudoviricetes sp.]
MEEIKKLPISRPGENRRKTLIPKLCTGKNADSNRKHNITDVIFELPIVLFFRLVSCNTLQI